eukprot:GEMP01053650.1.p1 GENE.GEMP01053650.1~~GEMP01053650.1.p1  ORF type:complete len:163 (+),score=35.59 GEMP01053650.1:177-665(+)
MIRSIARIAQSTQGTKQAVEKVVPRSAIELNEIAQKRGRIIATPFAEVGDSTASAASVMAATQRETSGSAPMLGLGIFAGYATCALTHHYMFPFDVFYVCSSMLGCFPFCAVVGSSRSPMWYFGTLPFFLILIYPLTPLRSTALNTSVSDAIFKKKLPPPSY